MRLLSTVRPFAELFSLPMDALLASQDVGLVVFGIPNAEAVQTDSLVLVLDVAMFLDVGGSLRILECKGPSRENVDFVKAAWILLVMMI